LVVSLAIAGCGWPLGRLRAAASGGALALPGAVGLAGVLSALPGAVDIAGCSWPWVYCGRLRLAACWLCRVLG
jgi:hypothetical protein